MLHFLGKILWPWIILPNLGDEKLKRDDSFQSRILSSQGVDKQNFPQMFHLNFICIEGGIYKATKPKNETKTKAYESMSPSKQLILMKGVS